MFRFSIRDLFWLTLVAALAAGWLVDRRLVVSRLDQFDRRIAPFEEEFRAIAEHRKEIGKNSDELYGEVVKRRKGLSLQPPEAEIPVTGSEAVPATISAPAGTFAPASAPNSRAPAGLPPSSFRSTPIFGE